MRTTDLFLFLLCFLLCSFQARLALDFLSAGQNITGDTSLVSAGQRFVLGFFSPPESPTKRYLGIWYDSSSYPPEDQRTVVWVANRDDPVVGSNGVFQMTRDGSLVVTNTAGVPYWSSKPEGSPSTNRTVKLLDSGNLVLIDGQDDGTNYIWQSFQHPTDTFLPGMKMDAHLNLTCWNTKNDPRGGSYIFMMAANEEGNPYYIRNSSSSLPHWKGGGNLNMGPKFSSVDYMLSNFSKSTYTGPNGGSPYKTIGCQPRARAMLSYDDTRVVMNYTGELQFLQWDGVQSDWIVLWKAPASSCDVYNACGHFTSCNSNSYGASNKTPPCRCLPGFIRVADVDERDYECARNPEASSSSSSYSCREGMIRFLSLTVGTAEMGNSDITVPAENVSECRQKCLDTCSSCQAYSYAAPPCATIHDNIIVNDTTNSYGCRIWIHGLDTIQEEYPYGDNDGGGPNLFVRVYKSDIEPTPKTCEPCGTKIVPYPLSTGRNCGDPKYFNFICNNPTGQLRFLTTNAAAANTSSSDGFIVGSMEVKSRKFVIRIDTSDSDCEQAKKMIRPPFNVSTDCIVGNRVEVTWQPPLEPICNKSADCEGWSNSSCKETKDRIKRCLCDSPYQWDNVNLSCTRGLPAGIKRLKAKLLIAGITLTGVVILACAIIFAYAFRRKLTLKKEKKRNQRNREHFHDSVRHVKDLIEVGGLEEEDNEGIEVPYFDFESILVATDNFSDANKLGKGGYGPVYKGKLQSGEVVAVKRLSSVSSQGLQEFKNEVVLIAKLQHRNLVRLRGYCIKGNEKILLYEYMHNKSLDLFIFDPTKSQLLNWQMRFEIILGVARGMLYLHHDSRLRIIHRDLKISNILLNEEMQPKISDFGLAKIVSGKETEANTTRVVGTYGYMSPEYALDGLFSTKSDVFSFGVVVLEIISGKKNTGFYNSEQFSSLLTFAWILWTENRLLDLMDMSLGESCNTSQFIRCAHIGLLCVQDEPGDRPTMSNVVTLLDSETSILPTPKQPTFFANRGQSITTSSSKPEISMQFESSSQEVEYSTMGL